MLNNLRNAPTERGVRDPATHGTEGYVELADGGTATHRSLANLIERSPEFRGQPVRLISSNTGAAENGLAQRLADKFGVPGKPPTDKVWLHPDGRLSVGTTAEAETGTWKTLQPGGRPR